jgi:hypothetical protein
LSGITGVGIKSWLLADLNEIELHKQDGIQHDENNSEATNT